MDDLLAFWRLLDGGVHAVTEGLPGSGVGRIGELFPAAGGEPRACRFGAYLEELDQFDAAFSAFRRSGSALRAAGQAVIAHAVVSSLQASPRPTNVNWQ